MSCDTGKRNWNYRFTETNWDTVITPDMIFNFFLNIKELKKRGLQLRAIKNLIPQITASMTGFGESASTLLEGEVIDHAEVKTDRDLKEKISQKDEGKNDKILEFQAILERLITQELKAQNEDEERCRSLDYAIRRQQLARKEAAAAAEEKIWTKAPG